MCVYINNKYIYIFSQVDIILSRRALTCHIEKHTCHNININDIYYGEQIYNFSRYSCTITVIGPKVNYYNENEGHLSPAHNDLMYALQTSGPTSVSL